MLLSCTFEERVKIKLSRKQFFNSSITIGKTSGFSIPYILYNVAAILSGSNQYVPLFGFSHSLLMEPVVSITVSPTTPLWLK